MKKCENHDNWCECEKRGCQGCFHNKYMYVEKSYIENLIKENEKLKNNGKKEVDNIGMNYNYIKSLFKGQPDLYSILWDIHTLSISNKCYTIEFDHRRSLILNRFIDKLLRKKHGRNN